MCTGFCLIQLWMGFRFDPEGIIRELTSIQAYKFTFGICCERPKEFTSGVFFFFLKGKSFGVCDILVFNGIGTEFQEKNKIP